MTSTESTIEGNLRAQVQKYRVSWSILPKRLPPSMNGHRIGFEIELWGTHNHPAELGPGECVDCRWVVDLLREVARWISPRDCDFRTMSGAPVDSRSTFHPRDGFGRSVRLGIEVVCRSGRSAVAEQCDAACLTLMKERLISLGARRI